ncbi:N-acetylmuramoyl-L-alanine amidase, family 2 [Candidatus Terasakiella magnetica]|uniref:N-acetylmuramoyl-L-alanine amidase n=1 Tax=Candidatus Terasakiella magnetica TaxID=1867952 RepID=A0A1C3RJF3_9PROT|nr:N-acetylmuramoyl-L-alanine amidase [Candidatus Terasakiella magnetica]SCA57424.1 N-acetylmuramoyl-L-alanine amidase, family 2 [Candidatus Terasakiella magnetica]
MMDITQSPSPNFDDRPIDLPIDMLILHYTGMKTGAKALERMCDPAAEVSAHYMVEEDGSIFQLVSEDKRAWHAGVAFWRGHTNINARSIGIEIVNPGHEWGYRPFPEAQIMAVITLCKSILSRHMIEPRNIIGHSDVAPTRKMDPGELFPWELLAHEGIGIGEFEGEASQETLAEFGYDITDWQAALTAFNRHFRPENLLKA